jgi:predicted dehydrogenase
MLTAVVVEKPFVNTSAEADRLIALAKEKGKILTVFQSQYITSPHSHASSMLTMGTSRQKV